LKEFYMPRGKPNPKPRTLDAIQDDIEAAENTLAGLRKEFAAREAELVAKRDAIALELGAVCGPKRLTDVDGGQDTDIQAPRHFGGGMMHLNVGTLADDLTIPAFLRREKA
jgi:hypothetical protein